MADVKISELPVAGAITGSELVPVVQSGVTKRTTASALGGSSSAKVYRAVISQTGTDDPIATVLENTLGGDILWSRPGQGHYNGELIGAFLVGKVIYTPPGPIRDVSEFGGGVITLFALGRVDDDNVGLWSGIGDVSTTPGNFDKTDGLLSESPVQILIYP